MAEPVDSADDFRTTTGAADAITMKFYDVSLDIPGASTVHGNTQYTTGCRDPKRDEYQGAGDGEVHVMRTTWYVDGSVLSGPAPMKSLIIDGSDTWVIDSVMPDAEDGIYSFPCTLLSE